MLPSRRLVALLHEIAACIVASVVSVVEEEVEEEVLEEVEREKWIPTTKTLCGFQDARLIYLIQRLPSYMERETFCLRLIEFFLVLNVVVVEMMTRKMFRFFQRGCRSYVTKRRGGGMTMTKELW